jgi:NADH pyrophosphatase NudC (nudix superfamily)
MTKDEALKLALEALEYRGGSTWLKHGIAVEAIKEALAQPDAFEQGRQEGMKQERALWTLTKLGQEIEAQPEERNFCPRCGKRTADSATIHTCTPPRENT